MHNLPFHQYDRYPQAHEPQRQKASAAGPQRGGLEHHRAEQEDEGRGPGQQRRRQDEHVPEGMVEQGLHLSAASAPLQRRFKAGTSEPQRVH